MALSSNIYSSLTPANADDIFTTTLLHYMPELVDQIFQDYVILNWLKNNGNMQLIDGGERIVEPLAKSKNTTAGFFSMYDPIDVTPNTPLTSAWYEWKFCSPSDNIIVWWVKSGELSGSPERTILSQDGGERYSVRCDGQKVSSNNNPSQVPDTKVMI